MNPSEACVKWIYMVGLVFPVILVISYVIQKLYDSLVQKKNLLSPMLFFIVLSISVFATYHFVDTEFMVAKELPSYQVGPHTDDDTIRVITVMLRFNPKHDEAVEPLREWVNQYNIR